MKYFVQINESNPNMMVAGELTKLDECEYCDTTTGAFDGLAKINAHKSTWESAMNNIVTKFNGKIDKKNFELHIIRTVLHFVGDDIGNNLPFWWLVEYSRPDKIDFGKFRAITEAYLVDHTRHNLWIRGETKNNLELASLEDSLFRKYAFGSNSTHLIFERFKNPKSGR